MILLLPVSVYTDFKFEINHLNFKLINLNFCLYKF